MEQKPISSQTTPILFQHPTTADLHPSRWQIIYTNAKEFSLFALLTFVLWVIVQFFNFVIRG
ncbi:hypothetical protein F4W09_02210 [Acinetobacter tandoii]|uniref:Uncharacterized protein n=1 Tax=Acinetobacter tandoii TaxID=202954 RepID=A0A5N4WU91_9GAMM|nr:hypothetical protein F4W09_02210 [Acinetobacter tandoii]